MDLRAQTCCFTGHRILSAHERAGITAKLDSILLPLIARADFPHFSPPWFCTKCTVLHCMHHLTQNGTKSH